MRCLARALAAPHRLRGLVGPEPPPTSGWSANSASTSSAAGRHAPTMATALLASCGACESAWHAPAPANLIEMLPLALTAGQEVGVPRFRGLHQEVDGVAGPVSAM